MNALRRLVPLFCCAAFVGESAAQRPTPSEPTAVPAAVNAPAAVTPEPAPPALSNGSTKLGAAGVKLIAPPPLSPRLQQVRSRIEALFRHRNETQPPTDPRLNPFRSSAGSAVATAAPGTANSTATVASGPPPPPVNPDLALLQQAAAALKVAGAIQINGRAHLIINQAPYKEGDVLVGRAKGQAVYLRLKQISRFTFTLTYNDTELAVKY